MADAVGLLEVDGDVAPAAVQHVAVRRGRGRPAHGVGALDADDVGAHVGQHHGGERPRPDAGDLDDAVALQWSAAIGGAVARVAMMASSSLADPATFRRGDEGRR